MKEDQCKERKGNGQGGSGYENVNRMTPKEMSAAAGHKIADQATCQNPRGFRIDSFQIRPQPCPVQMLFARPILEESNHLPLFYNFSVTRSIALWIALGKFF